MATRKPTDAEPFLPAGKRTLPKLREASAHCQGCDLYLHATQTVFGEGSATAGIAREATYVTNAVKHFKFEERGKARLHKRPRAGEVKACRPWLSAELELIRPEIVVLLGATAAQAIFGPSFRITRERGQPLESKLAPLVIATAHPSSILRAPDDESRRAAFDALVEDLRLVAERLNTEKP